MTQTQEDIMKSFDDLDRDELYRAAIEDFAVPVEEEDNADVIRAALLEDGIKWQDYKNLHPELFPVEEVVERIPEPPRAGQVVTSSDLKAAPVVEQTIRVAEPLVLRANEPWLIKMTRENILFEVSGYRFTQDHPYALVAAEDVEDVLNEDGFRQAKPSELADFYK
jgi:hypothetical protein